MIKLTLFVILFVDMVFGAVVFDENANSTKVTLKADFTLMSMLERNNTADVHLIPLEKQKFERQSHYASAFLYTADYELGRISDRLIYNTNRDFEVVLTYPGIDGTVISSILVLIMQSSNIDRTYLISGGIGQQHATIVVEAKQTYYLSYSAIVFGH